jgi:hypothetical protein
MTTKALVMAKTRQDEVHRVLIGAVAVSYYRLDAGKGHAQQNESRTFERGQRRSLLLFPLLFPMLFPAETVL